MVEPRHIAYWRDRQAKQAILQHHQTQQAWAALGPIAQMLRQDFGATRILVFGSLVRGTFHPDSDLDLAVAGIPPDRYFEALAAVNQNSPRWIDLKPLESLEAHFRDRVLATGVEIDAAS
jgi:predicted nucleotidyltransferase